MIGLEIRKFLLKSCFSKKGIFLQKEILDIQKNFESKKFVQTKREKKSSIGKKIIFFIFYVKHVSIANIFNTSKI